MCLCCVYVCVSTTGKKISHLLTFSFSTLYSNFQSIRYSHWTIVYRFAQLRTNWLVNLLDSISQHDSQLMHSFAPFFIAINVFPNECRIVCHKSCQLESPILVQVSVEWVNSQTCILYWYWPFGENWLFSYIIIPSTCWGAWLWFLDVCLVVFDLLYSSTRSALFRVLSSSNRAYRRRLCSTVFCFRMYGLSSANSVPRYAECIYTIWSLAGVFSNLSTERSLPTEDSLFDRRQVTNFGCRLSSIVSYKVKQYRR